MIDAVEALEKLEERRGEDITRDLFSLSTTLLRQLDAVKKQDYICGGELLDLLRASKALHNQPRSDDITTHFSLLRMDLNKLDLHDPLRSMRNALLDSITKESNDLQENFEIFIRALEPLRLESTRV